MTAHSDPRLPPFSLGDISLTAALACAPAALLTVPAILVLFAVTVLTFAVRQYQKRTA